MSAKRTIRYPCKCSRTDPEHTQENGGNSWIRYVCSSCDQVKFARRDGADKVPKEKGLQPIHRYRVYRFG